jgi:hypothetical protein
VQSLPARQTVNRCGERQRHGQRRSWAPPGRAETGQGCASRSPGNDESQPKTTRLVTPCNAHKARASHLPEKHSISPNTCSVIVVMAAKHSDMEHPDLGTPVHRRGQPDQQRDVVCSVRRACSAFCSPGTRRGVDSPAVA